MARGEWFATKSSIKTLGYMLMTAILAAGVSAALIVGAMIGVQDTGTLLIGSDRWFVFYMIPVVVFSAFISVVLFGKFAQEKISWTF
jgi:hypothetical protein